MSSSSAPASRVVIGAALLDVLVIVLFAAVGRASHDEAVWIGLARTAWPFVVGAAVGWVAVLAWRAPAAPWRTGLVIWAGALVGGMLLRVASGQGVQPSFVVVAAIVLFVFLVGWRLIAGLIARLRSRRSA